MTQLNYTAGPYRFHQNGAGNLRMYSVRTGQTVAYIISSEWGDYENAPDGVTALANASLFRFAEDLLSALMTARNALGLIKDGFEVDLDANLTNADAAIESATTGSAHRDDQQPSLF